MADTLSQVGTKSESVKVVVRCRPMTEKELGDGHQQIVEMDTEQGMIELRPSKTISSTGFSGTSGVLHGSVNSSVGLGSTTETIKQFTFDAVYDWNSRQGEIYEEVMRPLVNCVLEGFNGTIFAYGQTGTGKTYTMEGIRDDAERKGVIPNSFSQIFAHIARTSNKQYLVRASYLEIYQEEIRDLLSKDQTKRLELKERADIGVYVKDLSSFVCKSIKEIEHVMTIGNQNRSVGATNMNEHSSRSHAIFIITIEHSDIRGENSKTSKLTKANVKISRLHSKSSEIIDNSCQTQNDQLELNHQENGAMSFDQKQNGVLATVENGGGESMATDMVNEVNEQKIDLPLSNHIRVGKLNLVDLAGSERQVKTGTAGKRQKEAIKINLSLSALGNVISALVDGKSTHIPYRDSKLTRILQDSLGGNSKTVMIANIGPASYNYEETLTTLRYASRAKNIKNKPRVNEDPKDALLRQFQLEIERLKYLLSQRRKGFTNGSLGTPLSGSMISSGIHSSANGTKSPLLGNQDSSGSDSSALDSERLAFRIRQMESKLLCGGLNIIDHTNDQQRELERREQQIAEQKRREREWRQKLAEQEENTLEVRETFSSLQQEVELKKRKLRKLFAKLQSVRGEIRDSQEANAKERRELEELQSDLLKELKLKYLIIENFLPPTEKNKLLSRIQYDEDGDEWRLQPISSSNRKTALHILHQNRFDVQLDQRQLCHALNRHLISSDLVNKNLSLLPISLRYQNTGALILNLIQPNLSTQLHEQPVSNLSIEEALESALSIEPEIIIHAENTPKLNGNTTNDLLNQETHVGTGLRPKTSTRNNGTVLRPLVLSNGVSKRTETESQFPKARGLVRR